MMMMVKLSQSLPQWQVEMVSQYHPFMATLKRQLHRKMLKYFSSQ